MNVTLARAHKERSRLAGKLKKNVALLEEKNSVMDGSNRPYDLRAILAECESLHSRLVALRKIIAEANAPIAATIVEKEELKSFISSLRGIDPFEGIKTVYQGVNVNMTVVLQGPELAAKADALEAQVERLQDEIDEYNAHTKVDISDESFFQTESHPRTPDVSPTWRKHHRYDTDAALGLCKTYSVPW